MYTGSAHVPQMSESMSAIESASDFFDTLPTQGGMQETEEFQRWLAASDHHPTEYPGAQQQDLTHNSHAHIHAPAFGANRTPLPNSATTSSYFPLAQDQFTFVQYAGYDQPQQHYAQTTPTGSQPGITNSNQSHTFQIQQQQQQQPPKQHYLPPKPTRNGNSLPPPSNLPLAPNSSSKRSATFTNLPSPASPALRSGDNHPQQSGISTVGEAIAKARAMKRPKKIRSKVSGGSSSGRRVSLKRSKRPKEDDGDQSDRNSDDEDDEDIVGYEEEGTGMVVLARKPGACTHCKKVKMRCEFPKFSNTCVRCKQGGHLCVVEGRKQRTLPNKREWLLAQIRQKDKIIESLLKQIHNPYTATPMSVAAYRMATSPQDRDNQNVLHWLDRLQSSVRDAGGKGGSKVFNLDDRANLDTNVEDGDDSDHNGLSGSTFVEADEVNHTDDWNVEEAEGPIPDSAFPLGLIANLSISNSNAQGESNQERIKKPLDESDDENVGVANVTYFMPGPATNLSIRKELIEAHSPPEIIEHGLVTPEDVDELFNIFYNKINPFVSLLDRQLHTPTSTFTRCPFLYTAICAISSRYYAEKTELYPIAMHFAKHAAANALTDGWKSVELCQAYILMSIYAVPARKWEEDRSWLYTGLAIRIATDLNLHQVKKIKPQNELHERELLNQARTWIVCFNLDRSTATQFGKPTSIKEDFIVRNSKDWYKKSCYNDHYDIHLCAYTSLLRIVARFHEAIFSDLNTPTGLNKGINFKAVTLIYDEELKKYHEEWTRRFSNESNPQDDGCRFRCSLLPFLVEYSRLVMFSFGLQQQYQHGIRSSNDIFFTTCLSSAKAVVSIMVNTLAPSKYMRYAPDGHFVFASFASAFLLKFLRPEFAKFLTKVQEQEVVELIKRLIQSFTSPDVGIDGRHTPRLYARFLTSLLMRYCGCGASMGRIRPQSFSQTPIPVTQGEYASSSMQPSAYADQQPFPQGYHRDGGYDQIAGDQHSGIPIYQQDVTLDISMGNIDFSALGEGFLHTIGPLPVEDTLATMQAVSNPAFSHTMLMPGFAPWSESHSPLTSSNGDSPPSHNYNGNLPQSNFHDGFHGFRPA